MNYYDEIKNKLIDNEVYSRIKDYSKERHKVITYFEIGKLLNEAGGKYGENIIKQYAKKLTLELKKKYTVRTLFRIRQFYILMENKKVSTLSTQLSWSHYSELLPIKNIDEINYYIKVIKYQNLSVRELRNKIKNNEYERLDNKTKEKLLCEKENKITDFIKNPIIIKNNSYYKVISEKILKKLILEDIENFMKELGNFFCFVGSEYKIKIGDNYNYIDLLLYNIKFRCYVVIELKIIPLKKEHIGQIQTYMNYIDKNIKTIEEDNTIGIIIVKRNNKYIMEYCSDERIISKEYELV